MTAASHEDVPAQAAGHPVIFFDGLCGFCDGSVQFVLKRDRARHFRYSPLQSDFAGRVLGPHGIQPDDLHSIVVLDGADVARESAAVVKILSRLGMPWRVLGAIFAIVPRPLRDAAYRLVARNRYRLAGRKSACRIPSTDERALFIQCATVRAPAPQP